MKKEFKAPIVELRQLSTVNSIMDLAPSGDMLKKNTNTFAEDSVIGFNQWKGYTPKE